MLFAEIPLNSLVTYLDKKIEAPLKEDKGFELSNEILASLHFLYQLATEYRETVLRTQSIKDQDQLWQATVVAERLSLLTATYWSSTSPRVQQKLVDNIHAFWEVSLVLQLHRPRNDAAQKEEERIKTLQDLTKLIDDLDIQYALHCAIEAIKAHNQNTQLFKRFQKLFAVGNEIFTAAKNMEPLEAIGKLVTAVLPTAQEIAADFQWWYADAFTLREMASVIKMASNGSEQIRKVQMNELNGTLATVATRSLPGSSAWELWYTASQVIYDLVQLSFFVALQALDWE